LGSDASLEYLEKLLLAMQKTKASLATTRNIIKVSVDSGRMAEVALDKLDQKVNELDIAINNIEIKKVKVTSQIESLTNIELTHSAPLMFKQDIKKDEIFALKPLQELILASQNQLNATQSKRYYPKVGFNIMWSENYAPNDVAQDSSINEGYGYYQVGVSMPLYDKSSDSDIEIQKVKILKDKMNLAKTKQELQSQAKELGRELNILAKSQQLAQENISKQQKLLDYAKVAFKLKEMTQEDYLRYEDALLDAKGKEYQIISQKWQIIGKLSVIYGNNLDGVVK
jgi:outer membrane protein TolC